MHDFFRKAYRLSFFFVTVNLLTTWSLFSAEPILLGSNLRLDRATGTIVYTDKQDQAGLLKPERIKIGLLMDQRDGNGAIVTRDQFMPNVALLDSEPRTEGKKISLQGRYRTLDEKNPLLFEEVLTETFASGLDLSFRFRSEKPILQKTLCLNLLLSKNFQGRKVYFDGEGVILPVKLGDKCLFFTPPGKRVQRIVVPGLREILEVSCAGVEVLFCQYPDGTGSIRLYIASPNTEVSEAELKLSLKLTPYTSESLSLRSAANRDFRDETRDDGLGGWTDQGAQNDMSALSSGQRLFGNVFFDIIDAGQNSNRACLVFANSARPNFVKSVSIPVGSKTYSYLYLLHSTAWTPRNGNTVCGTIEVLYEDGSKQEIVVETGRDVGDWWDPVGLVNAQVVWKDKNKVGTDIGLYLSRFALADKKVSNINLKTAGNALWMIAGISGVKESYIPVLPQDNDVPVSYITKEDADWRPFTFSKDIVKGSALDFSFLQDAPAGKYGPVIIKDGKFVFRDRPKRSVRFFGTNLNRDIVTGLTKEECEKIADRMVAYGYNAVRFHHYDDSLIKEGATTPDLDAERLDRMDYLIYCLKNRGVYLVTDLYISRLKGFNRKFDDLTEVKFAAAFIPEVRENVKAYAKALLEHVNPYTKLALKDEPALATLSLINEDALPTHYTLEIINRHPYLKEAFRKAYSEWCASRQLVMPDNLAKDPQLLTRFLMDRQVELYADLSSYVRSLGVSHPLTDMNHRGLYLMTIPRNTYDFVENHQYHDHPEFTGTAFASDTINHDKSVLTMMGRLFQHGAPRIFGKPFTLTEWNFCYPNRYRSESGPVMGSYAALQDWDGLFRFDYSDQKMTAFGSTHTWAFNTVCDPMQMLSERITALFFLRGDVTPAKTRFTYAVTPEIWKLPVALDYMYFETYFNSWFAEDFTMLGAYAQIGSNLVTAQTQSLPASVAVTAEKLPSLRGKIPCYPPGGNLIPSLEENGFLKAAAFVPKEGKFESETGQLRVNSRQIAFRAVTPRSECLVQEGAAQEGNVLSVKGNTVFSTVFVGSVDGKVLTESRRLLVLHLTDLRNSQEKRTEYRGKLILGRGTGKYPLLARKGEVKITFKTQTQARPCIWALAVSGERLREVPFEQKEDHITFTASTAQGPQASFAYEVLWDGETGAQSVPTLKK